jgi:hypothetical protein
MLILGTNSWEMDIPKDMLIKQALKFTESVESQGIAKLAGAWIAEDKKLL